MLDVAEDVTSGVERASDRYYPLVLVVGGHGSGKTAALKVLAASRGVPLINLSLHLSTAMLAVAKADRPHQAATMVSQVLNETSGGIVVLDNTELLHEPSLQVDPLKVLQAVSRVRPVVASWSGRLDGTTLVYAEAGHPEYKAIPNPDVVLVPVGHTGTSREDGST